MVWSWDQLLSPSAAPCGSGQQWKWSSRVAGEISACMISRNYFYKFKKPNTFLKNVFDEMNAYAIPP